MTIALSSNTSWNLYNFRRELIKSLLVSKHEVSLIAPIDEYTEELLADTKCNFIPVQNLDRSSKKILQNWALQREYKRIYEENNFDIVLTYTIKPTIFGLRGGRKCNTKFIAHLTGLGSAFIEENISTKIIEHLYKSTLKIASKVVFQNEDDRSLFLKKGMVDEAKAALIHGSGVNVDFFARTKPINTKHGFSFLFVGRLLKHKGIIEFMEASKRMLELHSGKLLEIKILGDIDEGNDSSITKSELEEFISCDKRVKYLGPSGSSHEAINDATVVVLPSYREGLPKVLIEAMSMETPIISVNSPGCDELVMNEENGLKAKVNDFESLFIEMNRMFGFDNEKITMMGQIGKKIVLDKYDSRLIIESYNEIINSL